MDFLTVDCKDFIWKNLDFLEGHLEPSDIVKMLIKMVILLCVALC
jgi:hypothetical protein